MTTPKNGQHLNNRIGTETEGEGANGPIVTYKATKRNLALVEAQGQDRLNLLDASRCGVTYTYIHWLDSGERSAEGKPVNPIRKERQVEQGCGIPLQGVGSLCDECLGLAALDPVGHGWLYNILAERPESIPDAPLDYWDTIVHARSDYALLQTQKRPDSTRYAEQEPGPEELKGLGLDAYTYSTVERRLSGSTWEGKGEEVGRAIGLKKALWGDLAGFVASFARRVPQEEPNRLSLIEDLEQYLWKDLLQAAHACTKECTGHDKTTNRLKGDWETVKLTVSGGYHNWYKAWNAYRKLASDAHGEAISLERRAYAERDLENEGAWLEAEADPRSYNWEAHVRTLASYEYLLQVLPPEIRELVEKRTWAVPLTSTERARLFFWLKGGPTKRRTSPDGRNTDTRANSFQVYLILEGGLPAGTNGIVSWHKPAPRR